MGKYIYKYHMEQKEGEAYASIECDNLLITLEDDCSLILDDDRPLRIYAYVKSKEGHWCCCQDHDLVANYPIGMPEEYYKRRMMSVLEDYQKDGGSTSLIEIKDTSLKYPDATTFLRVNTCYLDEALLTRIKDIVDKTKSAEPYNTMFNCANAVAILLEKEGYKVEYVGKSEYQFTI